MTAVTISGADDNTPIDRMVDLSERFPFLEWGILLSESRVGTPRYPSPNWVCALKRQGITLSAHLCGGLARAFMSGVAGAAFFVHPAEEFHRIQVNGYTSESAARLPFARREGFEYILQASDEAMMADCARDMEKTRVRCSILFDPSGGRGRNWSDRWPRVLPGIRMGYAGGFGPDNVAESIAEIRETNGGEPPAWVDMESNVRSSNDQLDLRAVVSVCETVGKVNTADFRA
jgi:hypothetical protein